MKLRKWMDNRRKPLTVREVARRFGFSHTTVCKWLLGLSVPSYKSATIIAKKTNNKVQRKDFIK